MGIFSKLFHPQRASKERAQEEAARQSALGGMALEEVSAARARRTAAEQSKFGISSLLGAPGTYETPTAGTATTAPSSLFTTEGPLAQKDPAAYAMTRYREHMPEGMRSALTGTRKGILDPAAVTAGVAGTSAFRQRSLMTAEAEQLLKREGPLWDELDNSIYGTIYEGAAIALRDEMSQIKRNMAKGGTARRTALAEAQGALARERANTARTQQAWNANLKLFDFTRQYANSVQEGNTRFLSNIPLLSDSYQNAMTGMSELMISRAIPTAATTSATAYNARAAIKDSNFLGKMLGAGAMLVGSIIGGIVGAPAGGRAAGSLMAEAITGEAPGQGTPTTLSSSDFNFLNRDKTPTTSPGVWGIDRGAGSKEMVYGPEQGTT